MHRNPLFLLLLTLFAAATLWYSVRAAKELVHYARLSQVTQGQSVEWSVQKKGRSDFRLFGRFTFFARGELFQGEALLPRYSFRSEAAAALAIDSLEGRAFLVSYSTANPKIASLGRPFPIKSSLYALLLGAITVYFFWLGHLVVNRAES